MIRVLHVISTLAPAAGGPTEVLKGLAPAQAEAGLQITICTTDADNPAARRLPADYFRSLYADPVALHVFPATHSSLLFSPPMARWLRRNIRMYDIVHVHGLYRFPPTYAAYQARRHAVPYIVRPHGALDPFLYGKSSRSVWLKRLYERLFDLPNLRGAGAIHYTTAEERERATFLGLEASSFVVPNGLDWKRYAALPRRGAMRTRWGLGEAPMLLFLGRLHFKKGLDLLIPAFATLRRSVPEARLVIAGPDSSDYGKTVRTWVRERGLDEAVHFVGELRGSDVVQAYIDADLFVLPSYTENFGVAVAEAMACALPVVISDQVNIHAEVGAAGAGIVTPCDAKALGDALSTALGDCNYRQRMGRAGRRLVEERYTWPLVADALAKEYEGVIARRRSHSAPR